jgi:hypothetical protein
MVLWTIFYGYVCGELVMAISEVVFSITPKNKDTLDYPTGTPLDFVGEWNIKRKWTEIISIFPNTERVRRIPEYTSNGARNPRFDLLISMFPNIEIYKVEEKRFIFASNREYWTTILMPNQIINQESWQFFQDTWNNDLFMDCIKAEKENTSIDFFDVVIEKNKDRRYKLGKEKRNEVDLIDTWIWSDTEKTKFAPFRIKGKKDQELRAITQLYINDYGKQARPFYLDFDLVNLAPTVISDILDPNKLVEPRRTYLLDSNYLVDTRI